MEHLGCSKCIHCIPAQKMYVYLLDPCCAFANCHNTSVEGGLFIVDKDVAQMVGYMVRNYTCAFAYSNISNHIIYLYLAIDLMFQTCSLGCDSSIRCLLLDVCC